MGQLLYRGGAVVAGGMLGLCLSDHWPWWTGFWAAYLACEVIDYAYWRADNH